MPFIFIYFFIKGELFKVIRLEVLLDDKPEVNEEYRISLLNISTSGRHSNILNELLAHLDILNKLLSHLDILNKLLSHLDILNKLLSHLDILNKLLAHLDILNKLLSHLDILNIITFTS